MYFLNTQNRKHQKLYGPDAFYDLDKHGSQATLATDLRPGDTCAVISYENKDKTIIRMAWYRFSRERPADDENSVLCRVLCGDFQRAETFPKSDAAKDARYSRFFNVKGHFKQFSVMR
jgi:hypothetical protein